MSATGSMFGLAYGDALGKPTEFMRLDEIVHRYGPAGPLELPGQALVTDDTQMALAVAEALFDQDGGSALSPEPFAEALGRRFVEWASSPENNRAPGMTCLRACGELANGTPWVRATIADSKGCGANMRVTPLGLVPGLPDAVRSGASQLQAAVTHGHSTALAASELTAFVTHWLLTGLDPADLVAAMRRHCKEQRSVYRWDWLGELWSRSYHPTPEAYIARGWDDCLRIVDRLEAALVLPDRETDPCLATGEGWVAEEAMGTAVLCFLLYPDEPVRALGRAAATSGDSDSIAALTGAFAGARHGLAAFPPEWAERIEYRERLARAGAAWDQ